MKKIFPNCSICSWHIISSDRKSCCSAQGYNLTIDVYNTRQCKKLYKTTV